MIYSQPRISFRDAACCASSASQQSPCDPWCTIVTRVFQFWHWCTEESASECIKTFKQDMHIYCNSNIKANFYKEGEGLSCPVHVFQNCRTVTITELQFTICQMLEREWCPCWQRLTCLGTNWAPVSRYRNIIGSPPRRRHAQLKWGKKWSDYISEVLLGLNGVLVWGCCSVQSTRFLNCFNMMPLFWAQPWSKFK